VSVLTPNNTSDNGKIKTTSDERTDGLVDISSNIVGHFGVLVQLCGVAVGDAFFKRIGGMWVLLHVQYDTQRWQCGHGLHEE
jgi:hypothetical protein